MEPEGKINRASPKNVFGLREVVRSTRKISDKLQGKYILVEVKNRGEDLSTGPTFYFLPLKLVGSEFSFIFQINCEKKIIK